MRSILFLFISLISLNFAKAEDLVTAQFPDKLMYEGNIYELHTNPLEPYFEKHPDKKPEQVSSALWRGYVAHFEIIENQLLVTDITTPVYEENGEMKWVSIYTDIFDNNENVVIDWYSGILTLPYGEIVNYVHQGYASTYSNYNLLEIENGCFTEARNLNYKQFITFKKEQFIAFEKTETYKELFNRLKNNSTQKEAVVTKSYISDFILKYTSKFLVE
ncbi:hypothetical protein QSV08_07975 [Maribacter sp. BPC-D8]|uniref:hypothetical protein n=1 Tax=Maribacter sp. BPC-D8 TaxID=3053613 RepID=UPI002B4A8D4E|nr:hypothetical protein [Maribacter sp. BPC-D8]WRI31182.1 hypothetical protein QSV08_07975 [Maribacter sp. BPC-D8]